VRVYQLIEELLKRNPEDGVNINFSYKGNSAYVSAIQSIKHDDEGTTYLNIGKIDSLLCVENKQHIKYDNDEKEIIENELYTTLGKKNTKQLRDEVKRNLERLLPKSDIICDETNNPPTALVNKQFVVTVDELIYTITDM